MNTIKQIIFGKKYKLFVAKTASQKKKGMNIFLKSPVRCGMIFPYEREEINRSFTLSQTPFDLRVIFLDKNNNVVYQAVGKRYQKKPVVCKKPSMTVIEIPG
jgi:uncharacterized membrane protein (UPF0127 family)